MVTSTLTSLTPAVGWLAVLSVLLYVGCFAISLGRCFGWPSLKSIRRGAWTRHGIATMANRGFKLLLTLTFPLLVEALGAASTFWIYQAASVATLVFCHRFVP
jgi:hypothetical protein